MTRPRTAAAAGSAVHRPTTITPPEIQGSLTSGTVVRVGEGSWRGGVTSRSYVWERESVAGTIGTGPSLTITSALEGDRVRVGETVLGAFGRTVTAWSDWHGPFQAPSLAWLTDLALWLDAADTSTLTLDASAVSEWRDKSGHGRHFSQPEAPLRPARGSVNGKGTVHFTAAGQRLQRLADDLFQNVGGGTIFAAAAGRYSDPAPKVLVLATANQSSAQSRAILEVGTKSRIRLAGRRLDSDAWSSLTFPDSQAAPVDGEVVVAGGVWDWANGQATAHQDAATVGPTTMPWGAGTATSNTASNLYVGANGSLGGDPYIGHLCEVIAVPRVLTSTEIANVKAYLEAKWRPPEPPPPPPGTAVLATSPKALDWLDWLDGKGGGGNRSWLTGQDLDPGALGDERLDAILAVKGDYPVIAGVDVAVSPGRPPYAGLDQPWWFDKIAGLAYRGHLIRLRASMANPVTGGGPTDLAFDWSRAFTAGTIEHDNLRADLGWVLDQAKALDDRGVTYLLDFWPDPLGGNAWWTAANATLTAERYEQLWALTIDTAKAKGLAHALVYYSNRGAGSHTVATRQAWAPASASVDFHGVAVHGLGAGQWAGVAGPVADELAVYAGGRPVAFSEAGVTPGGAATALDGQAIIDAFTAQPLPGHFIAGNGANALDRMTNQTLVYGDSRFAWLKDVPAGLRGAVYLADFSGPTIFEQVPGRYAGPARVYSGDGYAGTEFEVVPAPADATGARGMVGRYGIQDVAGSRNGADIRANLHDAGSPIDLTDIVASLDVYVPSDFDPGTTGGKLAGGMFSNAPGNDKSATSDGGNFHQYSNTFRFLWRNSPAGIRVQGYIYTWFLGDAFGNGTYMTAQDAIDYGGIASPTFGSGWGHHRYDSTAGRYVGNAPSLRDAAGNDLLLAKGQWNQLRLRLKMNTFTADATKPSGYAPNYDGIVELYLNGVLGFRRVGCVLRSPATEATRRAVWNGAYLTSFAGGAFGGAKGSLYLDRLAVEVSETAPPPANRPPIPKTTPDQEVIVGKPFTVYTGDSYDPDNDPFTRALTFLSQPSGSALTMPAPNASGTSWTWTPSHVGTYVTRTTLDDGINPPVVQDRTYTAVAAPTSTAYVLDLSQGEAATGVGGKYGSSSNGSIVNATVGGRAGYKFRVRNPGNSRWGTEWRCAFSRMTSPIPRADKMRFSYQVYHPEGWSNTRMAPGDRKGSALAGFDPVDGDVTTMGIGLNGQHRETQFSAGMMFQARSSNRQGGTYYLNVWKLDGVLHNDLSPFSSFYHGGRWRYYNSDGSRSDAYVKIPGWSTITSVVAMNTPGVDDGLIEYYVDGRLVARSNRVGYRSANYPNMNINGWQNRSFHGGPPEDYPTEPVEVIYDDYRFEELP